MSDIEQRLRKLAYNEGHVVASEAADTIARLRAALERIAAYDDEAGNWRLARNGSYSAFDEPGSVQTARAALEGEG